MNSPLDTRFQLISSSQKDLGSGFIIRRLLPSRHRRSIGPFVFTDSIGPVQISDSTVMDVRPHPHIGLSTVTYLFSGRGRHRDSLGSDQLIHPGDINLMVAGHGIAHSERTPIEDRTPSGPIFHGLQFWMALPKAHEETEPQFLHFPKSVFPEWTDDSKARFRLLIGKLQNRRSPVPTFSETLLIEIILNQDAVTSLTGLPHEIGIIPIDGPLEVSDPMSPTLASRLEVGQIGFAESLQQLTLKSLAQTWSTATQNRVIVIGGAALPEPRHMWWNFVATEKQMIKAAADRWKAGQFPTVPGETDRIPLPDDPL